MRRTPGISIGTLCALALYCYGTVQAQSSTGVGDYVASGLGISSTSQPTTISPTQVVALGLITVNDTVYTATKLEDGEILVGNTTVWPSGAAQPTSTSAISAIISISSSNKNASVSQPISTPAISATASLSSGNKNASVDECFSSWESWWSASRLALYGTSIPVSTYTTTYTDTVKAYNGTTEVHTETLSEVETVMDGLFAISTETIDTTSISTYIGAANRATTSSAIYTETSYLYTTPNNTLPSPTCHLPSSVSQCQSQWDAFITTNLVPAPTVPPHCDIGAGELNTRSVPACAIAYQSAETSYYSYISQAPSPECTQASIGGALCSGIRENYVRQGNGVFEAEVEGYYEYFSAGYLGSFANETAANFNPVWTWPTAATLGVPSCTLGCGRCAVTGGTVQLIYWPQATATATGNNTARAASTAAPNAQALVTAETLGTTFTSPTLYISYANVYAANGCSDIGTTISNTIVAIPTDQPLSSVYGGTIPCDAHFRYTQEWTATAPFDVADLYTTPVPYSIYSSQPWCATYLRNNGCSGTCPMTDGYKPILVVPEEVLQDLEPAWSTCYGDIRGVYDPPIALQPAASVVGPEGVTTAAGSTQTQSATPASGPGSSTASETAQEGTATATVTAEPDNEGSTSQSTAGASKTSQQQSSVHDPSLDASTTNQASETPGASGDAGTASQDAGGVLASILGGGASTTSASVENSVQASTGSASASAADSSHSTQSPADPTQSTADPSEPTAESSQSKAVSNQASAQQTSGDTRDPTQSATTSPSQTVATVGSQTYTVGVISDGGSNSAIVVAQGGATVTVIPGASATSVGGQQVSAAVGGGIIVGAGTDASTIAPHSTAVVQSQNSASAVTIGTQTYSVVFASGSSSAIVVAQSESSVTVIPGGSATSIGGQQVSAAAGGGIVIGSGSNVATASQPSTTAAQSQNLASAVMVGAQAYSVVSEGEVSSGVIIVANGGSTATLTAGGSDATLGGQILSAPQSGGVVVGSGISAATIAASLTAGEGSSSPQSVVSVAGETFAVSSVSGGIILLNTATTVTLSPGGSLVTVGSEILSEASDGAIVAQSGVQRTTLSIDVSSTTASNPSGLGSSSPESIVGVGGETFAITSVSDGIILSDAATTVTLSAGGSPVTVGSEVLSEASNGAIVAQSGSQRTTMTVGASTRASHSSTTGSVTAAAEPSGTSTQTASAGRTLLPLRFVVVALLCGLISI
ncbi:hypothetical protein LTR85_011261 [Meristemomyces frigidus]|nr:hypothetical protein LTR85_011261 [Meristemomyces frigidus]